MSFAPTSLSASTVALPLLVRRHLVAGLMLFVLMGTALRSQAQCDITISDNGNRTYTTTAPGQTICMNFSGFSRSITIAHPGCTLTIASGASISADATVTLNASATSLTINNNGSILTSLNTFRGGTINNTGTWNSNIDAVTAATTVNNSGTWTTASRFNGVAAPLTLNNASGSTWATTLNTGPGGTLAITNNGTWNVGLALSSGTNVFTNNGSVTFPVLGFNGTATSFINQGTMVLGASRVDVQGNVTITNASGATLTTNALSINSGATFTNAGTAQSTLFYNDRGTTDNSGILRTSNDFFVYGGTFTNTNQLTVARNFTNNAVVAGPPAPRRGSITVAGVSTNTGQFGVSGQLNFCDAGAPASGFDVQNGTVGTATTFCSSTPLPVTLVSFNAVRQAAGVLVQWQTATEQQNAYFVLERGTDGTNFRSIQQLAGRGTTTQSTQYAFLDKQTSSTLLYYRLRQVDTDGTSTYSAVVAVPGSATATLVLVPNPARHYVRVLSDQQQPVQLLDLTGRMVRTQLAGESVLSLVGLKPGVYLVRTGPRTARLVVE